MNVCPSCSGDQEFGGGPYDALPDWKICAADDTRVAASESMISYVGAAWVPFSLK